jgi:hypothetical protein
VEVKEITTIRKIRRCVSTVNNARKRDGKKAERWSNIQPHMNGQ